MVQAGQLFNLTANEKYLEMGRGVRQILHKSDTIYHIKHYYSPTLYISKN